MRSRGKVVAVLLSVVMVCSCVPAVLAAPPAEVKTAKPEAGKTAAPAATKTAKPVASDTAKPATKKAPAVASNKTAKPAKWLAAKPGPISGKVLRTDRKTPAANVPVRVWSASKKKFVHRTMTAKDGAYKLPKLAPDNYLIIYADRVSLDLRVDEKAKPCPKPLNAIVPPGKVYTQEEEGLLAGMLASAKAAPVLTGIIVVGVAGAAVVGGVAAFGGGSSSSGVVSP